MVQSLSDLDFGDLGTASPTPNSTLPVLPEIKRSTYLSYFELLGDFISLDISSRSTGWLRFRGNEMTYGYYATPSGTNLEKRRGFRNFILELFGDHTYDNLIIENPIGGVNFTTNLILYQLNAIPEDLVDMGLVSAKNVIREGNMEWKKGHRSASGYTSEKVGLKNDKEVAIACNLLLGLKLEAEGKHIEDVNDAGGLAIGVAHNHFIKKKVNRKLRTKVDKGYSLAVFEDREDAYAKAAKSENPVHFEDISTGVKDIFRSFSELVSSLQDDGYCFILKTKRTKLGRLLLELEVDTLEDIVYLVASPKKR